MEVVKSRWCRVEPYKIYQIPIKYRVDHEEQTHKKEE